MRGPQGIAPRLAARLKANMMERIVDILSGVLAGLVAGLVAVVLGTIASIGTPDAPISCIGLMVAPPVVGGLCGGVVSLRVGRNHPPKRRR